MNNHAMSNKTNLIKLMGLTLKTLWLKVMFPSIEIYEKLFGGVKRVYVIIHLKNCLFMMYSDTDANYCICI